MLQVENCRDRYRESLASGTSFVVELVLVAELLVRVGRFAG